MGNYKFTFEDGSEVLAHHGVKGMKWGEWNDETRERYMNDGQEHLRRFGDAMNTMNEHAANQATMNPSGLYKEGTKSVPEAALANVANAIGHNVGEFTKEAGKFISDVSDAAIKAGKDIINNLFRMIRGATAQKGAQGYQAHAANQETTKERISVSGKPTTSGRTASQVMNEHAANQATMYSQPNNPNKIGKYHRAYLNVNGKTVDPQSWRAKAKGRALNREKYRYAHANQGRYTMF